MSIVDSILQFLGLNKERDRQEFAADNDADARLNFPADNGPGFRREFREEFAADVGHDDRVSSTPRIVRRGDPVRLRYQGILKNDGADEVYLHYGFDHWRMPVQTVKMARQPDGAFALDIMAQANQEINFCFKDSADHWDNNSGRDWVLPITFTER